MTCSSPSIGQNGQTVNLENELYPYTRESVPVTRSRDREGHIVFESTQPNEFKKGCLEFRKLTHRKLLNRTLPSICEKGGHSIEVSFQAIECCEVGRNIGRELRNFLVVEREHLCAHLKYINGTRQKRRRGAFRCHGKWADLGS